MKMLNWYVFENNVISMVKGSDCDPWLVMSPETDLEKSLLFAILCKSMNLDPRDTVPYDVDENGVWRHPSARPSSGSHKVDEYLVILEDFMADDDFKAGQVSVYQIVQTKCQDGTFQMTMDSPQRFPDGYGYLEGVTLLHDEFRQVPKSKPPCRHLTRAERRALKRKKGRSL